ncbi:MAG: sel1 repeat family protein [Magnetospirillum sp.]|nr:sel1 repeat family protein [Magnetospirillum sp.]
MRRLAAVLAAVLLPLGAEAAEGVDAALEAQRAGDFSQAWQSAAPLALSGDRRAQALVARMFAAGQGGEESDCLATLWHDKAARGGEVDSQLALAVAYAEGTGLRQDLELASRWALAASRNGQVAALGLLSHLARQLPSARRGALARDDWRPEAQPPADLVLLHDGVLAQPGAPYARLGLGPCRGTGGAVAGVGAGGVDLPRPAEVSLGAVALEAGKPDLAAEFLIPSAVAGDAAAQGHLATMYASGRGVPQDACLAALWTAKAAGTRAELFVLPPGMDSRCGE